MLIGFMGSGKTQVGKRLASRLGYGFIDIDGEIERVEGARVSVLFEERGEEYFRQVERARVREAARSTRAVISCGGGAVAHPDSARALKEGSIVVYLRAPAEVLFDRVKFAHNRPLIKGPDKRRRFESLLGLREPVYNETADIVIDTDGCSIEDVVSELERSLGERLSK